VRESLAGVFVDVRTYPPNALLSMNDLPAILDAIRADADVETHWLALSQWLGDNGRDDEAVAVRVFWAILRDNIVVCKVPLDETLDDLKANAAILGPGARHIEERRLGTR
jgi:hypothetical protein